MENQKLTIEEVLMITKNILNGICVPVSMIDAIGAPIDHAVKNITVCLDAIKNSNKQEEAPKDGDADAE